MLFGLLSLEDGEVLGACLVVGELLLIALLPSVSVPVPVPRLAVLLTEFDKTVFCLTGLVAYDPEFIANTVPERAIILAIESPIIHFVLFIIFPPLIITLLHISSIENQFDFAVNEL
ncbi:hypothetical protein DOT_0903 [Desulfosporosinus sp. OT]|nr:hypothetical protein DOT_0903 [Desulfosporosinus sp. OT]